MFKAMYAVVKNIPRGKVASYGTVARLAGYPRCSRQVGFALHRNPDSKSIPCHRVVFKDGSLSRAFVFGGENRQRELLEREGVRFVGEKVDMGRCGVG
jgi:methylated-DNA-protein-cysteine methyltransferase-like protein